MLTSGYAAAELEYCEITRALVAVRRFTGSVEPNVKFTDCTDPRVHAFLDDAERTFEARRHQLHPVVVI